MLEIYNIRDKREYLREVATLTQIEWGNSNLSKNKLQEKINKKIEKIEKLLDNPYYCKLVLIDNNELIGFISIFPTDGDERKDLSPWYSTMYVKSEYRGNGYSKILNNAILEEAKKRKIKRLYLKTKLENYYEKFGAKYIGDLSNGEKLYIMEL